MSKTTENWRRAYLRPVTCGRSSIGWSGADCRLSPIYLWRSETGRTAAYHVGTYRRHIFLLHKDSALRSRLRLVCTSRNSQTTADSDMARQLWLAACVTMIGSTLRENKIISLTGRYGTPQTGFYFTLLYKCKDQSDASRLYIYRGTLHRLVNEKKCHGRAEMRCRNVSAVDECHCLAKVSK